MPQMNESLVLADFYTMFIYFLFLKFTAQLKKRKALCSLCLKFVSMYPFSQRIIMRSIFHEARFSLTPVPVFDLTKRLPPA